MNMKTLLLAAALSAAAFNASAAITSTVTFDAYDVASIAHTDISKSFTDIFNFSLTGNYSLSSSVTASSKVSFTSFSLYSVGNNVALVSSTALGTSLPSIASTFLSSGNYYIEAIGTKTGRGTGSYDGTISVTAVPEPESYAMLLAGLGLMGTIARRRKSKAA